MKNTTWHAGVATICVAVLMLAGCGKQAAPDGAPFLAAIGTYLQQKSMGMKVAELKSLKISGDSAAAVASMQDAEGLYAVKVVWEFSFKRGPDGWAAISHKVVN